MKLLHISDAQLGCKTMDREDDFYSVWHEAISYAIDQQVDAVLIAGDLFEYSNPTMKAMDECLDGLRELDQNNIKTFIVSGNHDTPRTVKTHPLEPLQVIEGVTVCYKQNSLHQLGNLYLQMIPWSWSQALTKDDFDDQADIIMLHGSLTELPEYLHGSRPLDPGFVPDKTSYVAMGDIHKPIASKHDSRIQYAGALERTSFSEHDIKTGGWLLEFQGSELVSKEYWESSSRDMYMLTLETDNDNLEDDLKSLLDNNVNQEDIVKVTVSGAQALGMRLSLSSYPYLKIEWSGGSSVSPVESMNAKPLTDRWKSYCLDVGVDEGIRDQGLEALEESLDD